MDLERRRLVNAIFDAALAAADADRGALLAERCGDDAELRAQVERLLREAEDTTGFLEESPGAGLRAPTRARGAGERVGPYRLMERIGAGGMGEVWLADRDDAEFSMRVAIKFVRRDFDTRAIEARFKAERQVLAGLAHPNIARLLDGGATEDGAPYLVMEHVEGVAIDAYCDAHRLGIRERLALFRKVCAAVQHAHANLVVHRDLKPGNILVTASGEVKLLDFGIAKVLGDAETAERSMTLTGQRLLTITYASPEQVRAEPVTTATDIYSLGVILYELLAGSSPYTRTDNDRELESEICDKDPARPSTALTQAAGVKPASGSMDTAERASLRSTDPEKLRRALAGELDSIVLMAMRKEPMRRYASVSEFSDDIGRYLDGQPVRARPDTMGYRARKFVRRNRAMVAAAGAIALLLVAGVIGTSIGLVRALEAEAAAGRERDIAREQQALAEAAEARAEAEAAEARRQAAIAQAVNDFLNEDLLASVAPSAEAGRGRDVLMREVLDAAARRIEGGADGAARFAGEPAVEASIRTTVGNTYHSLGEMASAEPHLTRALALRRETLGEAHAETIQARVNLGVNLTSQGRLDEAIEMLRDARGRAAGALGEDDRIALNAAIQLCEALRQLGDFDAAEEMLRDVAARASAVDEVFGLQAKNNLAMLYENLSRYDESEGLFREILAKKRELLGEEDPSTAITLNNLAVNRLNVGQYAEAATLFEECLAINRRVLGEEHPGVITAMQNLALTYANLGRTDEASAMYRDALARAGATLGEGHPDALMIRHNLGALLSQTGQYEEAEALLVAAVEGRRAALGDDAPETNQSKNILGRLYLSQRDYARAEPLIVEALEWSKANLGESHNDTLAYMNTLGSMYFAQERYDDALPVYVETVAILKRAMPAGFIGTGVTLYGLGRTQARLERWSDAGASLTEAYEILTPLFGAEHPRVQGVAREMVSVSEASGDAEGAALWRSRLPAEGESDG